MGNAILKGENVSNLPSWKDSQIIVARDASVTTLLTAINTMIDALIAVKRSTRDEERLRPVLRDVYKRLAVPHAQMIDSVTIGTAYETDSGGTLS